MSKLPNLQTPDPDSPEFFEWARKLEFPTDPQCVEFWCPKIEFKDPNEAYIEAQKRIQNEFKRPTGKLDLRGLTLEKVPDEIVELYWLEVLSFGCNLFSVMSLSNIDFLHKLHNLRFLDLSDNQVVDFDSIGELKGLRALMLNGTDFCDLSVISELRYLKEIEIARTQIIVLREMDKLTQLQHLNLAGCNITELKGLEQLTQLQRLDLLGTEITELKGLDNLTQLQYLDLSGTKITELKGLNNLAQLQYLDLDRTAITELKGLDNLIKLQHLDLRTTEITELKGLDNLVRLQHLDLTGTKITELKGMDNLTQLQYLDLTETKITELKGLDLLSNLKTLDISFLKIKYLSEQMIEQWSLEELICYDSQIGNIPFAILSSSYGDNCLPRIKSYFASLKQGTMPVTDLKLMVLGNGQIGKTQLCRRLCGDDYDDSIPSTHGVLVRRSEFEFENEKVGLHLWDFGGQEIYHGTHSLFLDSQQTIFLLVWHPDREDQDVHSVDGMKFRNHPINYWLEHIKQQNRNGRTPITVIIAQSQCDEPGSGERDLPIDRELLKDLPFVKVITTSSKAEGGLDELQTAINNAIRFQRKNNPQPPVARSWHRVKEQIEQWICEDNAKDEKDRQHQLLTYEAFKALCRGENESDIEPELCVADDAIDTLLHMLHHSGVVFYYEGLFDNQILLDQSWALNAIYAVFHRDQAINQIRQRNGRFYAEDLGLWLWNQEGYSEKEQAQFLEMMESCGVCFSYHEEHKKTYVVPELLPSDSDYEVTCALTRSWDCYEVVESAVLEYQVDMLHNALFNRVLAMVGQIAQSGAVYWQDGLLAFETRHKSWLKFERKMESDFAGVFVFSARCGDADGLIRDIEEKLTREQRYWSVQLIKKEQIEKAAINMDEDCEKATSLQFDQTPPLHKLPELFISYSWREESKDLVDEFCIKAEGKDMHVIRDINALKTGDSISAFMRRIGEGKRVVVILSDAYLKSDNCMFELHEIWRTSKTDPETFRLRVKAFAMKDAKIYDLLDRLEYATYWKDKFEKVKTVIDQHGATVLGEKGYQEFERIQEFYLHVNSMLTEVADTLNPQNIDELLKYGLE